uniref:Uncharacterized protein n=1 Tax=Brugia malayi TaxID=6279 RepID=A8QHL4_BRUMA
MGLKSELPSWDGCPEANRFILLIDTLYLTFHLTAVWLEGLAP